MRFSIAALSAMAAGAVATSSSHALTTEVVTHYTTYCPEATSVVHGGHTYSISTPGDITMTHGPFTVTRPLITQTVTQCNQCSSGVPLQTPIKSPVAPPVAPSGAPSSGAGSGSGSGSGAGSGNPGSPSGTGSASPSQSSYNAGAINAATGAGAGLAAVFGAVALLL